MNLRMITGKRPHFGYVGASPPGGGSGGESLNHALFKEALATLGKVTLRLKGKDHRLAIEERESEMTVNHESGRTYRTDAFWKFSSDSLLDKKWQKTVHVEVHHTHKVDGQKLKDFRSLGIAMVEVKIPDFLGFRYGEDATATQCKAYIDRVVKALELPHCYLPADVISDPTSDVIRVEEREKAALTTRAVAAEDSVRALTASLETAEGNLTRVSGDRDVVAQKLKASRDTIETLTKENSQLTADKEALAGEKDTEREKAEAAAAEASLMTLAFFGLVAFIILILVVAFWMRHHAGEPADEQSSVSANGIYLLVAESAYHQAAT
jgi:hypothetical protein